MSTTENEHYPTLGIASKGVIVKSEHGWQWKINLHVQGPDDVFDRQSAHFLNKSGATDDLFARYPEVVKEMIAEI